MADGQAVGILKRGEALSSLPLAPPQGTVTVGHPNHPNDTYIGIFNLVIWENYFFSSNAYQLTGHSGTTRSCDQVM